MKKRVLNSGHFGSGLTVYDTANTKNGDYEKVAHINHERTIILYTQDLTKEELDYIVELARTNDRDRSHTQERGVFSKPPSKHLEPHVIHRYKGSEKYNVQNCITEVKQNLLIFLEDTDNMFLRKLFIDLEIIRQLPHELIIKITLNEPGYFIGKGGRVIDDFNSFLCKVMDKDKVITLIEEGDFWKFNR